MHRSTLWGFALLLAAATVAGAPARVEACGGLACSGGGPFNPVAVDQANERILFLLEDDGPLGTLMTAVIQIQYAGNADDFAWILPVPEVPELIDVAPDDFFTQLDAATAPTFQFTFPNGTFGGGSVGGGPTFGGCGGGAGLQASPTVSATGFGAPPSADGDSGGGESVSVWGTGTVGPYEMAIISSDVVDPLVEWIVRHGFNAPDELIALADDYVKENYKFVVMRLRPEAGIDQIAPVILRYHEGAPCVPLRLTSIAAVPDMGVRVYIVSTGRAVPLNFGASAPDWAKLAVSPNGVLDYDPFIASEVERTGGKAWVTEFAAPVANAILNPTTLATITDPTLLEYLNGGAYVTRLYTKISPWEMDEDPFFQIDPNAPDVSNVHIVDLSGPVGANTLGLAPILLGDALLAAVLLGGVAFRRLRRFRSRD